MPAKESGIVERLRARCERQSQTGIGAGKKRQPSSSSAGVPVAFAEGFSAAKLRLVELDPEVERLLLASGEGESEAGPLHAYAAPPVCCIKGARGGASDSKTSVPSATLCTATSTFEMRKAESSNTQLFLAPRTTAANGSHEQEEHSGKECIVGEVDHHYELVRVKPRLAALRRTLASQPLDRDWIMFDPVTNPVPKGRVAASASASANANASGNSSAASNDDDDDDDDDDDVVMGSAEVRQVTAAEVGPEKTCGFTMRVLLGSFQTSRGELETELKRLGAFRVQDKWMLLERELEAEIFDMALSTMVEMGMSATDVDVARIADNLQEQCSAFLLRAVLDKYKTEEAPSPQEAWRLDSARAAQFRAEQLLSSRADGGMDKAAFMHEWDMSLPRGVPADPKHVAALALERDGIDGAPGAFLAYYPASRLPDDPAQCFQALFAVRAHWKLVDMAPFIQHLLGPAVKQATLLRRFTRSARLSVDSEDRVLTAR